LTKERERKKFEAQEKRKQEQLIAQANEEKELY
jgi:hypothetical protein